MGWFGEFSLFFKKAYFDNFLHSVACTDHFSIRTSAENRSVTLATPNMYCTASMSDSPHLFVRHNERRIHFDGANFIVRNMGHSASFDSQNLLRIH